MRKYVDQVANKAPKSIVTAVKLQGLIRLHRVFRRSTMAERKSHPSLQDRFGLKAFLRIINSVISVERGVAAMNFEWLCWVIAAPNIARIGPTSAGSAIQRLP
ncbi:hypothetical protein SAMN05444678_101429 [Sphingomonas sp. YR710]|uniref:hypothetical protein n=1 Tax=Sphingomonas sp. YR710 TaxID=1882773 RepID=UPI0008847BF6|nr:hypothetical protein [Sphingomonas sp. YR710]SDC13182.1 hypothetical protein SAMN05444678_101429 [Sphingomonas sp. YR710]